MLPAAVGAPTVADLREQICALVSVLLRTNRFQRVHEIVRGFVYVHSPKHGDFSGLMNSVRRGVFFLDFTLAGRSQYLSSYLCRPRFTVVQLAPLYADLNIELNLYTQEVAGLVDQANQLAQQ